jgi:hypothetical protein
VFLISVHLPVSTLKTGLPPFLHSNLLTIFTYFPFYFFESNSYLTSLNEKTSEIEFLHVDAANPATPSTLPSVIQNMHLTMSVLFLKPFEQSPINEVY